MNEFENKDTGCPNVDAPDASSRNVTPAVSPWSTPDDLADGYKAPAPKAQPHITPSQSYTVSTTPPAGQPNPVFPDPPVYGDTRRKTTGDNDAGSYSTGVVSQPKSRTGLIIGLVLSGVVLVGVLLMAFGLIPGLPNYRFADDNNSSSVNNPGFEADNSVQSSQPAEIPAGNGTLSMDLQTVPGSVHTGTNGAMSLQEIYSSTIASVTSIICDTGSGTGVVLTKDGYVITNYHVIKGARSVEVLFHDGRKLPAKTVGRDEISDIAVLRVSASDLQPAVFGNSDQVQVGDTVVAIGDPLGVEFRGTMTDGIISAINRDVITSQGRTMTVIQTNAALNPGNSGGPLINAYGQVIGINTMKIGDTVSRDGVEGLGFAIPSTTVKTIVDQLMTIGYVTGRPYLGIDTQEYNVVLSYLLPPGLYITHVVKGTDAAAKGITAGEILLEFNGVAVTTNYELQSALEKCKPGETVTLSLFRQSTKVNIEVILGEAQ